MKAETKTLALRNSAGSKQRLNLENVANTSGMDHPPPPQMFKDGETLRQWEKEGEQERTVPRWREREECEC